MNLCGEVDDLTGEKMARRYFVTTGKVSGEDFPKIWWDTIEHLMKTYPKMYRVWLTKHVSD